ncbi:hypothetical protein FJR48_04495 [Sulfurimonas lithotrophica]|uniref:Uncharacterized protein n=1 Tax=Sulfurimonas lithotrophica TaxID=2590022 RepID=A0A5P8NZZ2_9BACT|nr:hypothetical protein [Sulfurimonas lithotrophica]QFR49022.1 hypothetical protein FJR48_04495 [Sulfurimonas lithotrophica]
MSEKTEQVFSSVVSHNPYDNDYVSGISSFLAYDKDITFKKGQYSISYINTDSFINAQISISKNIPEEDIYDAILSKTYDELALDQALSYKIEYIELYNALDAENKYFNVFIVDPLVIDETFEESIKQIKYIDTIIPSPLLFKSLYSKELITNSGAHVFLYFERTSAFIAIYNEKDFIFSKTIEYSFEQLHENFCELYGERIEFEEFIDFIKNEDLKNTISPYKEFFIKLYKDVFYNINDILTYVKRAYEIKKFEYIYIGTQFQTASNLDEICEFELQIKTSILDFDYGFESAEGENISLLHSLMQLHVILPDEEKYICNFTNYERPPRFIQRESGKLILIAAASLVLGFAYPVGNWIASYAQGLQKDILNNEYVEIHNKKTTREATIKNRMADKNKALKLLNEQKNSYIDKKGTLVKIHDVKVNYLMKAKTLTSLTKDLNNFNVKLESVLYAQKEKSDKFELGLVSYKSIRITKLIKHLTKIYEGTMKFSIDKIFYDEDEKKYFSTLKVEVL